MKIIQYILGGIFSYFRRCNIYFKDNYYKNKYPNIHKSVRIGYETLIYGESKNIEIGEGTYIQRNCLLAGNVKIGKNCAIASNVNILSETHGEGHGSNHKIKIIPIKIGNNVWIGTNVYIREGIEIGNNVIIGTNSVVTKNINDYEIAAGVPAKKIK